MVCFIKKVYPAPYFLSIDLCLQKSAFYAKYIFIRVGATKAKSFRGQYMSEPIYLLVGDVGGTNTNLGIAQVNKGMISILHESTLSSYEIHNFTEVVQNYFDEFKAKHPGQILGGVCISAAGPVRKNSVQMTNQDWSIHGSNIESSLDVPTVIINDFMAISYSLPILDTNNPQVIQQIPRSDGSLPEARDGIKIALGPGTGLGVGLLAKTEQGVIAYPSEGGHADFSAWDEETYRFKEFLEDKLGSHPGYEPVISGIGLNHLYEFYTRREGLKSPFSDELDSLDKIALPRKISELADKDPLCARIFNLFIRVLARFASNLGATLIPTGGIYIAGGISSKNLPRFLADNLFMKHFEDNYNSHIIELLQEIPVYVIMDYGISLLGAANAAINLLKIS
jgi:glucokinase